MEATEKEKKATGDTLKNMAIMLALGIAIVSLVYAKSFEYRPVSCTTFSRALNTAYQPSASRMIMVSTSVSISSNLSLSGGQSGTINLQLSPDNVTYTTIETATNNNLGTLTIGLNTTQTQVTDLIATVPPGYWYKFVSTGTSTFAINPTQETQM